MHPSPSSCSILIVGGAGYIGSHVNQLLIQKGFATVILDNLSTGHRGAVVGGLLSKGRCKIELCLKEIFKTYPIEAVFDFAACIDVGESVLNPAKYYRNNVVHTLALLDALVEQGIQQFIFSSTAAVYGFPLGDRIRETDPLQPINPYGESKRMVETILQDYDKAYGLRSICLRYFNAAGYDPTGVIPFFKTQRIQSHSRSAQGAQPSGGKIDDFWNRLSDPDGTCIRDYVHVSDLASAHVTALEHLLAGGASRVYNLGNGNGFSVREVVEAIEKATGRRLPVLEGPRRPGDPPSLLADATRARQELQWVPAILRWRR